MIPVYLKTADDDEPRMPVYYRVAGNGLFLVRNTPLFDAVTPVSSVIGLRDEAASVTLRFPRLPVNILASMYGFLLEAYRRFRGEAILFLYYSPEKESFRIGVPRQKVFGSGRVEYGRRPRPEGFVKLGDAHSHADLPAFFSHTDDEDDVEDGLHMVFGKLDRPDPEVGVSFMAGGVRFKVPYDHVFAGPMPEPVTPPERWLEKITPDLYGSAATGVKNSGGETETCRMRHQPNL